MSPNNYSKDFESALAEWRTRHHLREGDPLLLCLELFRIHQTHWDAIRREDLPSFSEVRDSLLQLHQNAIVLQRQSAALTEELRRYKSTSKLIAPSIAGLGLTALFAAITGVLIGKFIL